MGKIPTRCWPDLALGWGFVQLERDCAKWEEGKGWLLLLDLPFCCCPLLLPFALQIALLIMKESLPIDSYLLTLYSGQNYHSSTAGD
jgi:hypothetical protein